MTTTPISHEDPLLNRIITVLWHAPDIDTALADAEDDIRVYGRFSIFCAGLLTPLEDRIDRPLTRACGVDPEALIRLIRFYGHVERDWIALETTVLEEFGITPARSEARSGGLYHYLSSGKGCRVFVLFLCTETQSPVVSRLFGAELFYQGLVRALLSKDAREPPFFFGDSPEMRQLKTKVDAIIADPSVRIVLLEGPSGCGKTTLARYIAERSLVWRNPFRHERCQSMNPENFARWLFGVTAKAFSGVDRALGVIALANRGTLFLDDIHSLDVNCQDVLRNVMEDRHYTPHGDTQPVSYLLRWIFASAEDLKILQSQGDLRPDLHARMRSGEVITLRPLDRWSPGDRQRLFALMWRELSLARGEGRLASVADDIGTRLLDICFPRNLRQARALMDGTLARIRISEQSRSLLKDQDVTGIRGQCLNALDELIVETGLLSTGEMPHRVRTGIMEAPRKPEDILPEKRVTGWYACAALNACKGNKSETAKRLGISTPTLNGRLEGCEDPAMTGEDTL